MRNSDMSSEYSVISLVIRQIDKVIQMAGDEKAPAVGALTSENRDVWTDVRKS